MLRIVSRRRTVGQESRARPAESQSDEELDIDAALDDDEQKQPPIDFVLYLQQTGSIIALAKLMDALEYGTDGNGYNDEVLDENDLELIRKYADNKQSRLNKYRFVSFAKQVYIYIDKYSSYVKL